MSHIRREFIKTLFQKRTYIGWAGLFLIPFLITLAFHFDSSEPGGGGPEGGGGELAMFWIFQQVLSNGMYVALMALLVMANFFLPLLASMSGSYSIAGEAENGTLRSALMQPVRRGTFLLAKWFAANAYVGIGLLIMGIASLIAGGAFFGIKPVILLTGQTIGVWHALGLTAAAYAYIFLGMISVVSLAVLFSTLTNSSLTAVAGALVLTIIFMVLQAFPVFDFLMPYLYTSRFEAWMGFFQSPVEWDPIIKGLITFAVWIVGTTGLAWLRFRRKDILS